MFSNVLRILGVIATALPGGKVQDVRSDAVGLPRVRS